MTAAAQAVRKPAARRQPMAEKKPAARTRRKPAPKALPWFTRAWRVGSAIATAALMLAAFWLGRIPEILMLAYFGMAALSFALYGLDKRRAVAKGWRVPEATLHLVDMCGGIAGGLLAQLVFRHKTSKFDFVVVSMSFSALHVAALLLAISPVGAVLLGSG